MLFKEAFNSGTSDSIKSALNLPFFYLWFIVYTRRKIVFEIAEH
jgi:hypothetical protein